MSKHENIIELIGNTPLVRINRLAPVGAKLYAKVEYFNPASCLAEIVKNEIGDISGNSDIRFCVSKNPDEFKLAGKMFFDIKGDVELVG